MSPLKFSPKKSYSEITFSLYLTAAQQGEHGNKSRFGDVNMLLKGLSTLESGIDNICIAEPTKFNSQGGVPLNSKEGTLQHVNSSSCQNQTKQKKQNNTTPTPPNLKLKPSCTEMTLP